MWFGVVTLFPELLQPVLTLGVTGRAIVQGLLQVECWNPRQFTSDLHQTVDDRPYGGGPGMVMKVAPLQAAIGAARAEGQHRLQQFRKERHHAKPHFS